MPGANVRWQPPVARMGPWYPGQFGVPGADQVIGERYHCTGKVIYVDPNFPGASDQRDGTSPTAPMATVQAAINLCTDYAGDVVAVMQNADWPYADAGGVYTTGIVETVTLDKAGVHLVGLSPGGIGVPWVAAGDAFALSVTAMDCLVEGFAFGGPVGGGDGIYVEWDGTDLFGENLVVRNCLFSDTLDIGLQLEYSWYCVVQDCFFDECDEYGIFVDVAGSGIAYSQFLGNWFHDCAIALHLNDADYCLVKNNTIFNSNAQNAAAATNEGINTTGGGHNLVADNFFSCLLPVPANGDYDDLNTAAATDAWVNNHCMDGDAVTNPT